MNHELISDIIHLFNFILVLRLLIYYLPYFIYINFYILTKLVLFLLFSSLVKYLKNENIIYIL